MFITLQLVQQCIQISTRINSSMYIRTSSFVSFETYPIFNKIQGSAHPGIPTLSFSCSFRQKKFGYHTQLGSCPPPPPPQENPASATGCYNEEDMS